MSYLQNLARLFAQNVGDQLQHYTFVFPNQRAGLFFRRDLGVACGKPTLSPTVLTINDCFYQFTSTKTADPIDLLLRIHRIHNELRHQQGLTEEDLDTFLFWGKMILGDFNEIDNHLVDNPIGFLQNIREAHDIEASFQTEEQAPFVPYPPLDVIYQRLQDELRQDGLAYDGMLHREVIEALEAGQVAWLDKHPDQQFVFIGFNALTQSEERLMVLLQEQGRADFYFDYSHPWVTDKENRSSLFMEHNQKVFHSRYTVPTGEIHFPQIHWIELTSTVGEAQEVHRILSELERPLPLTRTAVVMPDERMLLPLLHTLPEDIEKINVTAGYPLAATPVFALIQIIADLHRRKTEDGFYYKDVKAVLAHPYIHRLSLEACVRIQESMVKQNLIYVPVSYFEKDEYLSLIFSDDSQRWREILNHLPEDASEAVYKIQTVLNRIDKYLSSLNSKLLNETTSFNFQLSTLNLMLSSETIAYVGEPLEGLQIMGVLETRALDFEHLIITSFNDDIYPGNSIANSFIPYSFRCKAALPTSERKDAIFAYNFYRMISYAKDVWLLTNSRSDEQHSGEPSRYLFQLQYQFKHPIIHHVVQNSLSATLNSQLSTLNSQLAQRASTTLNSQLYTLNSFSPSGLNSYLRCPKLYYWQYIRGLQEPEEVTEEIDPRELGTKLHLILQNCYEPFVGKVVEKEDVQNMLQSLPAGEDLLSTLLREYARLFLERDLALAPFQYIATEQPRRMELTLSDGTIVTLKGTIDRVDCSLSARIVDYKTGGAELEFSSIASLFDPTDSKRNGYALQTILYAILYGQGEPHIYGVRLLAQGADTAVHQKGQSSVNIAEIKDEFLDHVRKLIQEIRDPENTFPCTEDTYNKCTSCPFAPLCDR
ncbi:MAG: PD-(D/E)XK nuclease family protein [Paludibacteraceae bacterium]|nr:PD-(D/E)XK nuclease family protein [Paludibacteraceae bacterium]